MIIKKILNNNAVVVWKDNQEAVVVSKGIAFGKKTNDAIEVNETGQIFTLDTPSEMNVFQELMLNVPIEYLEISKEIIEIAEKKLGKSLNQSIYIHLTDHIKFAVERYKNGVSIPNGLLWEIKQLYRGEYNIGLDSLSIILTHIGILLPEDEAGFIALHIFNAELNSEMPKIQEMTKITREIMFIIKYNFKLSFDENSISYNRLLTHLKFFSQRLVEGIPQENATDEQFSNLVAEQYHEANKCALKIKEFIQSNYDYDVTTNEITYLTIHINRLIQNEK